jgi:hypothetical protein
MFIGIDVAKAGLVVSILPSAERFTVANDERGARTLVEPWRNARRRPTSPHLTQDRSAVQPDRCAAPSWDRPVAAPVNGLLPECGQPETRWMPLAA